MNERPESAPEIAAVLPRLEDAAIDAGRAPYAGLYGALAAELSKLPDAAAALNSLGAVTFATPEFKSFVRRTRVSCGARGLADESAYHAAAEELGRLKAAFPFTPRWVRFAADKGDDALIPEDEDAAYAYLAAKVPVTRAQFDSLVAHETLNALTVANLTEEAIRNIVKPALLSAVAGKITYSELVRRLKGQPFGVPGRLSPELHMETVYRTNVAAAYNFGRVEYGFNPELAADLPGGQLMVVLDERTSDICRLLYGRYVPRDLIISGRFVPPFHFSCRTAFAWVNALDWRRVAANRIMQPNHWETVDESKRALDGFGYFRSVLWAA